ncbi:MAG: hypothetical protein LDLANPLL_01831 [Turneriella sp.]|nr:hypothetical protein [Turneriella sp.]
MKLFSRDLEQSNRRLKFGFWAFFVTGALFSAYDLFVDIRADVGIVHISLQIFMSLILFAQMLFLFVNLVIVRVRIQALGQSIQLFKTKTRAVIERQFRTWQLSEAEKKVAFFILRGYDFGQIADFLEKGERTVRAQAIAIYRKTGFRSRAEFTGFFVETILMTDEDETS